MGLLSRLRRARPRPDRHADAGRQSADDEEVVTIEAGQVTLTGPARQVEHAVAVGLYGEAPNRPVMGQDEDHVMTGVYIGVGLLLAAGAGYLAWRYLLDDGQKSQVKDALADGTTKARRLVRDTVRDAKGKLVPE